MEAIQATIDYVSALNAKLGEIDQYGSRTFDYKGGRVYDSIWVVTHEYRRSLTNNGIHAFVDRKTGGLIKSATWKAPQKNSDGSLSVRYDLSNDAGIQKALDAADMAGFYLLAK
jgi:hypothetical protein